MVNLTHKSHRCSFLLLLLDAEKLPEDILKMPMEPHKGSLVALGALETQSAYLTYIVAMLVVPPKKQ